MPHTPPPSRPSPPASPPRPATATGSSRTLALLIVAGWTTLAVLRIALRFAFGGVSPGARLSAVAAPLLDAVLWAAVTLAAVAVVRRVPWNARHAGRALVAHALCAAAAAAVEVTALRLLLQATDSWVPPAWRVTFLNRLDLDVFSYLAAVGVAYALDHRVRARTGAAAAAALQARLAAAQLHVLTIQLQPHFLFNTLHTISELVHTDAAAARRTLGNLAALFRMSLDGAAAQEVTLDEELRFLAAYVDIQLTRFGDRLTITTEADDDARRAVVPHLILQPLVENAIRHGTARRAAPGHVVVSARRLRDESGGDDGALEILVRDDGPGLGARPPMNGAERSGSGGGGGLGIGNTRARLRQLYGDAHVFEIQDAPGGGVLARVRVPWRTSRLSATATELGSPATGSAMSAPAPVVADDGGAPWGARRWAAVVFAAWTTYGLLAAQELHLMYTVEKMPPPTWGKLVALSLTDAWGWALWTALVVWLARRVPLDRRNWRWLVPAHLALAHAVAFTHLWFLRATSAVASTHPFVDPRNLTIIFWDVFAYLVVLAFTYAVVYRARWRARERESARLAAEVAATELELLRWRLQPRFLLDTLAAISSLVDREVERADGMVARLGDLLRSLLPHVTDGQSTLRDELARLDAYLDLVALRSGWPVTMRLDVDADVLDLPMPPMALQPMAARALGLDEGGDDERAHDAAPASLWLFAVREGRRLVIVLRRDGASGALQRLEVPIAGASPTPHGGGVGPVTSAATTAPRAAAAAGGAR